MRAQFPRRSKSPIHSSPLNPTPAGEDDDDDNDNDGIDDDDDNDGINDDDDEDSYVTDPTVTLASIQDCKAVLDALQIEYATGGATIFCPRERGVAALATFLGFASTQALLDDLALGADASLSFAAVDHYFRLLVVPGQVVPLADIPLGASQLTTALAADDPNAVVTLRKKTENRGTKFEVDLYYKTASGYTEDAEVERFDFTFDGRYDPAAPATYVVHVLEKALRPEDTYQNPATLFAAKPAQAQMSTSVKLLKRELDALGKSVATPTTIVLPSNTAWKSAPLVYDTKTAAPTASSLRAAARGRVPRPPKKVKLAAKLAKDAALREKVLSYYTLPAVVSYSKKRGTATPYTGGEAKATVTQGASVVGATGSGRIVGTYRTGKLVVNVVDGIPLPAGVKA